MSEISKRCDVCGAPLEWSPMWGMRVCRACIDAEWPEPKPEPTVRVYERDDDPRRCVVCDTEYNGDTLCPVCYPHSWRENGCAF